MFRILFKFRRTILSIYHFDSRHIKPGDTFICLPGAEPYIQEAKKNGALHVIKMDRQEMASFSASYFNHPSSSLRVIGITGTNGKTSVAFFVHQALTHLGYSPLLIGTITHSLTTPESLELQRLMADYLAQKGTHVVMEVSSHGIAQHRVDHIQFSVKALTNITQDHLDYHGTFEAYQQTKLRFMNSGDMPKIFPQDIQAFSLPFSAHLPGEFNVLNLKTAFLVLKALGYESESITTALSQVKAPPGRFESIALGQPFTVIVDYAHTPDGLEKVLKEARQMANQSLGKLKVLFGCGGDRDKSKRPLMGQIASRLADDVVITNDNPRSEDPKDISNQILSGIIAPSRMMVCLDRQEAIFSLIAHAKPGDVLVLAGKGHETTQILKTETLYFDDREIAKKAIQIYHHF